MIWLQIEMWQTMWDAAATYQIFDEISQLTGDPSVCLQEEVSVSQLWVDISVSEHVFRDDLEVRDHGYFLIINNTNEWVQGQ